MTEPSAHLAWLRDASDRFANVLTEGPFDAPVVSCGDWLLRDLAGHLGAVQRWARRALDGTDRPLWQDAGTIDDAELEPWFREGADELHDALAAADPERPCWTLAEPRTARFWMRRQAHEATIHRWDAEAAQGSPGAIDAEVARDGIDEVIGTLLPRQMRLGRMPAPAQAIRFETPGTTPWVVPGQDGSAPVATVRSNAEVLLLALWKRLPLDDARIEIDGSREAASHLLSLAITA